MSSFKERNFFRMGRRQMELFVTWAATIQKFQQNSPVLMRGPRPRCSTRGKEPSPLYWKENSHRCAQTKKRILAVNSFIFLFSTLFGPVLTLFPGKKKQGKSDTPRISIEDDSLTTSVIGFADVNGRGLGGHERRWRRDEKQNRGERILSQLVKQPRVFASLDG